MSDIAQRIEWIEAERIRRTERDVHHDSPGVCAARVRILMREIDAWRGDKVHRG